MAVGCDPYWQAHFQRLEKRMPRNQAIVAIARRMLVAIWHILSKQEPYRHFDPETIAYKMLTWARSLDYRARQGLTRQQLAKYGLLRLGIGQDLERIRAAATPAAWRLPRKSWLSNSSSGPRPSSARGSDWRTSRLTAPRLSGRSGFNYL